MEKSLSKPEELFNREKNEYDTAKSRYLQAIKEIKPLANLEQLPSPPLTRAAYSDRMAWIMANMAKLAYIKFEKDPLELEHLKFSLLSGNFELVETFNEADTQAFIAKMKVTGRSKRKGFAVLAFRGTQPDTIGDIRTDLAAYKTSMKTGRVHSGFIKAYEVVADKIEKQLEKDRLPLYVTGHSLGGALATVATKDLEDRIGDRIAACYTFGSPRVGNVKFNASVKAPIYRIVNCTDIVTLVPTINYFHIGDTRYLTRNKDGELIRGIPTMLRTWEFIVSTLLSLPKFWSRWVGAHDMAEYIHKLEGYAARRNGSTLEELLSAEIK